MNQSYYLENNFEDQKYLGIVIGDPSGNWTSNTNLFRGNDKTEFFISSDFGDKISILIYSK